MSTERDRRLQELFSLARSAPARERERLVFEQAPDDPELVRDVLSLLRHDTPTDDLHDHPARAAAAELVRAGGVGALEILAGVGEGALMIGRFRVLRTLGAGGYGAVYLVEQESPRRLAALKVIHPSATPTNLRRFRGESEALARLRHPGIAQIYEAGVWREGGDRPYIAMEYVEGLPLDDYAAAHALGHRQRAELLARIGDAVEHAHRRGVIHRDLAPKNILVDGDGSPRILDFGVARLFGGEHASKTMSGDASAMVGTLGYMSPEQLSGDPLAVDTRADVYALGVIAYELFTRRRMIELGERPLAQAIDEARSAAPARPSTIDRSLVGDLEAIILKATEKDADRRYQSASDLASDLRHWLKDEPVVARAPGAVYVTRKFVARHRGWTAATVALLVVLGAATAHGLAVRRAERASHDAALNALDAVVTRVLSPLAPKLGSLDERAELLALIGPDVEQIATRSPDGARAQRLRARYLAAMGDIEDGRGGVDRAIALREEALGVYRGLVTSMPGDAELHHEFSLALVRLGDLCGQVEDYARARLLYEEALRVDEEQVRRHPEDLRLLSNLVWSYRRAGDLHAPIDPPLARSLAARSAEVAADMLRIAPGAWRALEAGVAAEIRLSELARASGDMAEAEGRAYAAIALAGRLIEQDPLSTHFQAMLVRSHWAAAMALAEQGRTSEVQAMVTSCERMFRDAAGYALDPAQSLSFERLVVGMRMEAALAATGADWNVEMLTEGIDLASALMRRMPGDFELHDWRLGLIHERLLVHARHGRSTDAERDAAFMESSIAAMLQTFPERRSAKARTAAWTDALDRYRRGAPGSEDEQAAR